MRHAKPKKNTGAESETEPSAVSARLPPLPEPIGGIAPSSLEYFDRKRAGFDGVRRLDISPMNKGDWIRIETDYETLIEYRKTILDKHDARCVAVLPEGEAAAKELQRAIAEYLVKMETRFSIAADCFVDLASNRSWNFSQSGLDALRSVGTMVTEDFVIASKDKSSGEYCVLGGVVCFPAEWSLPSKLGLPVSQVHEVVPELNLNLGTKISRYLDRLKVGRPGERSNFLIHTDDRLCLFPELIEGGEVDWAGITADNIGETVYLRSERETFVRLPESRAIAFGIKSYICRFDQMTPAQSGLLHDLIREAPEQYIVEYKLPGETIRSHLLSYLKGQLSPD